jgi:hypothetical protein
MRTDPQFQFHQQATGVCRMKKDTHPDFYEDAKVGHAAALCFFWSHPTFPSSFDQNSRGQAPRASGMCGPVAAKCRHQKQYLLHVYR